MTFFTQEKGTLLPEKGHLAKLGGGLPPLPPFLAPPVPTLLLVSGWIRYIQLHNLRKLKPEDPRLYYFFNCSWLGLHPLSTSDLPLTGKIILH